MELVLTRDITGSLSLLGTLLLDDQFQCYTLEGASVAIPFGRYPLLLLNSRRFQMVTPHLQDVPGRTAIEIHPGNTQLDTEGCILVGTQRDQGMLQNSRIAFTGLMTQLQVATESMFITIA